jgi:hypothetical protein
MRTTLIAVVTVLLIAGGTLLVYGVTPMLGESQSAAAGAAFVALLGMAGATLALFALAGARGRL